MESRSEIFSRKKDDTVDIKAILAAPGDTRPHTVLIDAYQFFFKQHFTHKHLVRGAVFGFVKLLLKLIEELKPYDFVGEENRLSSIL